MAFAYHFPSNTPAQSSRRRQLLDAYGQFAQLSAIILPLFLFLLSSLVRFLFQSFWLRRGDGYTALRPSRSHHPRKKLRQSPHVATFSDHEVADSPTVELRGKKVKEKSPSTSITHWWARFQWALDETVAPGWGTWREWSVAAVWTVWLLVLTVENTGDGAFADICWLKLCDYCFFLSLASHLSILQYYLLQFHSVDLLGLLSYNFLDQSLLSFKSPTAAYVNLYSSIIPFQKYKIPNSPPFRLPPPYSTFRYRGCFPASTALSLSSEILVSNPIHH